MKYGVRNSLAGVVAGVAIGVAAFLTPQAALSKAPKTAPPPAAVHDFNKEKNKIEKSALNPSSISKSGLSYTSQTSYSIPGLSVEPATTEALVRRLENAQVIIQAIDHGFDAGRDKHTALLRQLQEQGRLNIGAVLIEEFPRSEQDSLTAFCTSGKQNMLTEAVAYTSYPRGPNTQYSLMWLLAETRALGMDILALGPERDQPKYDFMNKPNPDLGLYVDLFNQEALSTIQEQLAIHPGQRIVVQVGSVHVPRLQALLSDAGITSSSFEIWKPVMDLTAKKNSNSWVTALVKKSIAAYSKYIPRLRPVGGDAIIDNASGAGSPVSPTSNFIIYSPDAPLSDMDYWHIMPAYFEREIRNLESKLGREWMAKKGVLSPDGALPKSSLCP